MARNCFCVSCCQVALIVTLSFDSLLFLFSFKCAKDKVISLTSRWQFFKFIIAAAAASSPPWHGTRRSMLHILMRVVVTITRMFAFLIYLNCADVRWRTPKQSALVTSHVSWKSAVSVAKAPFEMQPVTKQSHGRWLDETVDHTKTRDDGFNVSILTPEVVTMRAVIDVNRMRWSMLGRSMNQMHNNVLLIDYPPHSIGLLE